MTTASMQPGSRRKQTAINVAIVLTFIGFALFPFLCIVGEMLLGRQAIRLWFEGPGIAFSRATGLGWPASANVITSGDTHGGFNGDGDFWVVFEADRPLLEYWKSDLPPWSQVKWLQGPVPEEITRMTCLVSLAASDAKVRQTLKSDQIWYAAEERSADWWNGSVLILDLPNRRVMLCVWDM